MMSSSCSARFLRKLAKRLARFARAERGAILVEFAIALPMLVLVFAMIVEGSRMMWSYQSAISGVRDATRYLARVLPASICTAGGSVGSYQSAVTGIVANSLSGAPVMAGGVTVNSVTPRLVCRSGTYRGGTVAVAEVSASVTITLPLASLLAIFGGSFSDVTTTVTDQSRVFGA